MIAMKAIERVELKRAAAEYIAASQHATLIDGRKLWTLTDVEKIAQSVHVSVMSGKLEDLLSVTTTCVVNPVCLQAMQDPESPCYHCFAAATAAQYNALREWAENNYYILNGRMLSDAELDTLCVALKKSYAGRVRIEFAGDVGSVLQARNYLRLIARGASYGLYFGVWTKQPAIWDAALTIEGKPENATFIVSACGLNATECAWLSLYGWIDCVFVVCNAARIDDVESTLRARGELTTRCKCEKGSCAHDEICGFCYRRSAQRAQNGGRVTWILEALRV